MMHIAIRLMRQFGVAIRLLDVGLALAASITRARAQSDPLETMLLGGDTDFGYDDILRATVLPFLNGTRFGDVQLGNLRFD
jgi:hypothetical protein